MFLNETIFPHSDCSIQLQFSVWMILLLVLANLGYNFWLCPLGPACVGHPPHNVSLKEKKKWFRNRNTLIKYIGKSSGSVVLNQYKYMYCSCSSSFCFHEFDNTWIPNKKCETGTCNSIGHALFYFYAFLDTFHVGCTHTYVWMLYMPWTGRRDCHKWK